MDLMIIAIIRYFIKDLDMKLMNLSLGQST